MAHGLSEVSMRSAPVFAGCLCSTLQSGEPGSAFEPAGSLAPEDGCHNQPARAPSTRSQLAKSVNSVLTMAYRDIYAESASDDVGQLQLLTSPLAATEEVVSLFAAGLVPVDLAMPSVLHAMGSTKEDIDRAVDEAKNLVLEKKAQEDAEKQFAAKERDLSIKEREAALKQGAAATPASGASGRQGGSQE